MRRLLLTEVAISPVCTIVIWLASDTVSLSDRAPPDGGITMMNDEEFQKFLKELRSAYGLSPMASRETVDCEDFITEDDYVSESPFQDRRWRQDN